MIRSDSKKKVQGEISGNKQPPTPAPDDDAAFAQRLKSENRELRKRLYKLHNLIETSFLLNASLEEPKIIQSYLLNLLGLIKTQTIVVLLSESPYSSEFKPGFYQGIRPSQISKLGLSKNDRFVQILSGQQYVQKLDILPEAETGSYEDTLRQAGIQMVAPIVHRGAMLGFTAIGERHDELPYGELDTEIFWLLTSFLAVAIANSRLYKEMERVSLTDPLTGLYNRRYFENSLRSEVARAARFSHPLSLVMLDIDHFKNYNDQLGHTNGDLLLKGMANVLTKTIRTCDTIARYGGEEFCVILPEINKEGATLFSRRLRDIINQHPFERREIQPQGCITVSMGIATYPNDANRGNDLVDKADSAMYRAKKHGRNQVSIYQIDHDELLN